MPVEIWNKERTRVVRRSQNLRGLQVHNRTHLVFRATIMRESDGGGMLYVEWNNGDWARVSFADYGVLVQFMLNRLRSWDLERTQHDPGVQRFSVPAGAGPSRVRTMFGGA